MFRIFLEHKVSILSSITGTYILVLVGTSQNPYGLEGVEGSYTLPSGDAPRNGYLADIKVPDEVTKIRVTITMLYSASAVVSIDLPYSICLPDALFTPSMV